MVLPTFLGIGVQRGATTWLHDCLAEHPDVFVPKEKELGYFNYNFEKGLDWYQAFFRDAPGHRAIGEITPLYLHTAPIARIADQLPDAKLLLILREPISRAYSAYQLMQKHQVLAPMPFEEALHTPRGEFMIECSQYAERLGELFQIYPREQVKIFLFDDVSQRPAQVIREVFRFIGVDDSFTPQGIGEIRNRVMFPRTQKVLHRFRLGWTVDLVKRTPLSGVIKRWHKRHGQSAATADPSLTPALRERLAATFREDILRVQELIDRDLSGWLTESRSLAAVA